MSLDLGELTDLDEVERLALAAICRSSFADFVKEFWDYVPGSEKLKWNWHLDVFCDELQTIAERVFAGLPKNHDLVCNCPPGTSKSTIWSILFPAWCWIKMPTCRILTASHTSDLVLDLASKSRDVIESDKFQGLFPEIQIREDTNAKGFYRNDQGGERRVCTVAGKSPMGFHAHIVIIDDPIDPKKVLSEAELQNAKQFVDETITSRVVEKEVSVIVLVMQRLGLGDPTDVMLQGAKREGAWPIRHVCLPSELEVGDDGAFSDVGVSPPEYAKRYINGLLDPVRLSARALAAAKSKGPLYYATQFLQRPYAREGGMFHLAWFHLRPWVRVAPYNAKRIRYWDRAATESGGCYSAGVLMAYDGTDFYVEHVVHGQWGPDERNQRMIAQAKQDRLRYGPKHDPVIYVEAERGSTGLESFRNFARQLPGYRVREDVPSGAKDTRAEPWADKLAAGLVVIVDDGSWDVDNFITEHVAFKRNVGVKRYGAYKDQVDAAAAALNLLVGKTPVTGAFRVLRPRSDNKTRTRVVVVTWEQLERCEIADRECLLVLFEDPREVMSNSNRLGAQVSLQCPDRDASALPGSFKGATDEGRGVMCNGDGELYVRSALRETLSGPQVDAGAVGPTSLSLRGEVGGTTPMQPPPHLLKLQDAPYTARFADLDAADVQEQWNEILPEYGKKPVDVLMSREDGKKLWAFLLRKRPAPVTGVVFVAQGDDDRRALSIAYAYVDAVGLPRTTIWNGDDEMKHDGKAPSAFLYDQFRSSRSMVM